MKGTLTQSNTRRQADCVREPESCRKRVIEKREGEKEGEKVGVCVFNVCVCLKSFKGPAIE